MLYHYTDLNAVMSIVKNSEIWMTDYRYLNDKMEFSKGHKLLLNALKNFDNYSDIYPEAFKLNIKSAYKEIEEDDFIDIRVNNIFVASFSKKPDALSQWRSYGMYCVELDSALSNNENFKTLTCHYVHDPDVTFRYATEIITDYIIPVLFEKWKSNDNYSVYNTLTWLIEIYALSFKHEAFSDEDEIRLVVNCGCDDPKIDFRSKGDILIPFYRLKLSSLAVKEIIVGPVENKELAIESMCMFSQRLSRETRDLYFEINIGNSSIPYRKL